MNAWIVFTTWLCFSIAIVSGFTNVTYTTNQASVGSYQMFITALRRELSSGTSQNGNIPLTRRPSAITNQNRYLLVKLNGNSAAETITLALNMENAYLIGYLARPTQSYFFRDSPNDALTNNLLFPNTNKTRVEAIDTHYTSLGDRSRVPLGISAPIRNAINILRQYNGGTVNNNIRESLLVLIQVVSEAARFRVLQRGIEANIQDTFRPAGVVISYQNNWDSLSQQIQTADANGRFPTPVQLQNDNYTPRTVSFVSDVSADMGLLHYYGPRIFGDHNINSAGAGAGDLLGEPQPVAP